MWEVGLPNVHDLSQPWRDTGYYFDSKREAVKFVKETFGGDKEGMVSVVSRLPEGGWAMDFPNPDDPTGSWVNFDVFPTKAEAVEYLRKAVNADSQGRISLLFAPPADE